MSDSAKYNDFDELYEDFMECGSEEWLLPECGVKEELEKETIALLRSFWYDMKVWRGEDSKLLPTANDNDPLVMRITKGTSHA